MHGWLATPAKCLFPVHLRYSLERPLLSEGLKSRLIEQVWSLDPAPSHAVWCSYLSTNGFLPAWRQRAALCSMGYSPRQSSNVTKDAASAAQTTGALFWKALSACLWGRWAVTGNPAQRCQVRGWRPVHNKPLLAFSASVFDEQDQKHLVHSCRRTFLPYLLPELYPFKLLQATIHARGWKLCEFPSLASRSSSAEN